MNDTFMKEKPVFPLLTSMALPMVASMLVSALYNIVDSLYVARIPLLTGARQATPTAGALGERTRPYGVWSICAHPITGVNPYSRRYCLHSLRKTATRKIF